MSAPLYTLSLMTILSLGCGGLPSVERMSFSPDGRVLAYVVTKGHSIPPLPHAPQYKQTVDFCWTSVSNSSRVRSVRVETIGQELGNDGLSGQVYYVFSPDSRRVAILTPDQLTLLELASASTKNFKQPLKAASWLSNEELACASGWNTHKSAHQAEEREISRIRVDQDWNSRTRVFRGNPSTIDHHAWSSHGAYLILAPTMTEDWRLLDGKSGQTIATFTSSSPHNTFIAWRPDDSAVACISISEDRRECHAIFIPMETRKAIDFGKQMASVLCGSNRAGDPLAGRGWNSRDEVPAIEPLWTADCKYLILPHEGCLVQPQPWTVVRLKDRFEGLAEWLRPLSAPNWLLVRSADAPPTYSAVNTDFARRVSLEMVDFTEFGYFREDFVPARVSPDGSRTASWNIRPDAPLIRPLPEPLK